MPDEPTSLGPMALNELHARDRAAGVDPFRPERAIEITQPPPPGPRELRIEQPDWEQERLERLQREAAERRAQILEAAAELEAETAPPKPTPPAAKRTWRRSSQ